MLLRRHVLTLHAISTLLYINSLKTFHKNLNYKYNMPSAMQFLASVSLAVKLIMTPTPGHSIFLISAQKKCISTHPVQFDFILLSGQQVASHNPHNIRTDAAPGCCIVVREITMTGKKNKQ